MYKYGTVESEADGGHARESPSTMCSTWTVGHNVSWIDDPNSWNNKQTTDYASIEACWEIQVKIQTKP